MALDTPVADGCHDMTKELLNIKEVAALLRLAEKTVYSMAQAGELPVFKVRGQWRVRRDDLDVWMQEQRRASRPKNKPTRR
jgi:excisionase family DNA binding protein